MGREKIKMKSKNWGKMILNESKEKKLQAKIVDFQVFRGQNGGH